MRMLPLNNDGLIKAILSLPSDKNLYVRVMDNEGEFCFCVPASKVHFCDMLSLNKKARAKFCLEESGDMTGFVLTPVELSNSQKLINQIKALPLDQNVYLPVRDPFGTDMWLVKADRDDVCNMLNTNEHNRVYKFTKAADETGWVLNPL